MHYLLKKPSFIFGITLVGTILILGIIVPFFVDDPEVQIRDADTGRLLISKEPSEYGILGTDQSAQDFFSNLVWGIRNSMFVGFIVGIITTTLATLIGGVGAYIGGFVDEFGMLISNIVLVFPVLPALLVIAAYIDGRSLYLVILIIALISWPWAARAVRSQVLSLKEREFVHLAKISGISRVRIALFEVLPHVLSYLVLVLTISTGSAILAEAGISIIGFGPDNSITLGTLLQRAITYESIRLGYWWIFVFPGLILTFFMFGLFLIQTNLDAIFNPKLREE